ncbi:MAG: hypothetical protein HXY40_11475 [Chloroflexi bacterium]|nr:hypothetical protein [Chloroflexota bacterium]
MNAPYKVLIAYRPFTVTDPVILNTLASEQTIQTALDALRSAGFDADILHVNEAIRHKLEKLDNKRTLIFNYCDGYLDDPNGLDPITALMDELGIVYTGADDAVLHLSCDKSRVKQLLLAHHLPTPAYVICEKDAPADWPHFPALVKPVALHSSFGISSDSVVDTPQALAQQVRQCVQQWQQPALVEDFIDGTEYRVSLWGNGDAVEVLPLLAFDYSALPDYHHHLKDFDTKWYEQGVKISVAQGLDAALKAQIERISIAAYRAIGARDYGAMDVRVRGGQPYLIDINPNPDFSDASNFFRSARSIGCDYAGLLAKMIGFAAQRLPL